MATERVWTRSQVAHILGVQESAVKLWKEEGCLVPSYPASLPVSGGRTVDGYTRSDLEKGVILSGNIQERRIKHPPPPGYVEVSTVSALFQISDMQSRSLIRRNEIPHYYYKPVRSPVTI